MNPAQRVRVHIDPPPAARQEQKIAIGIGLGKVISRKNYVKNVISDSDKKANPVNLKRKSMISKLE